MDGGVMICQTPRCTAASCGSGQLCCTYKGPFQATCQMGTTCPRGSYQLCSSSADCSPQNDTCVAVDSGGAGTMFCFAGVADAGSGGG